MKLTDIKSALTRGAAEFDKHTGPSGVDRTKFVGSSELGNCIRKAWYSKHTPGKADERGYGFARRGHVIEQYMTSMMLMAGMPLRHYGDAQETLVDTDTNIMATPDGVLLWNDGAQGVEFKSIDPRTNRTRLPKSAHVTQLKVAMALLAQHHGYDFKAKGGLLMYTDASNLDDIEVFEVDFDEGILDKHARRAQKILRTRAVAKLDREGKVRGECRYCEFAKTCGVEDAATSQAPAGRANRGSMLDSYVSSYAKHKAAEQAAKEELGTLKEAITRELQSRKTNELVIAGQHLKLAQRAGNKTLDKKAVAAAGIDLSPYEKAGRPFTVLTIKPA